MLSGSICLKCFSFYKLWNSCSFEKSLPADLLEKKEREFQNWWEMKHIEGNRVLQSKNGQSVFDLTWNKLFLLTISKILKWWSNKKEFRKKHFTKYTKNFVLPVFLDLIWKYMVSCTRFEKFKQLFTNS